MRQFLTAASAAMEESPGPDPTQPAPRVTRLLGERLELVEDLWKTVLRSECPPEQAERLLRLKELSEETSESALQPEKNAPIVQLIREMDLAEAIAAARAFSLYFQLVNILEQHIEEDSYLASLKDGLPPPSPDPLPRRWPARPIRPPSRNCSRGCAG